MKFAVVKFAGSQYKISEGDKLEVTGYWGEKEKEILLDQVLLYSDGDKLKIGKPVLKEVLAKAEVLSQNLGEKLFISKFKAKTGYRRKMGFRPEKTTLLIKKVEIK